MVSAQLTDWGETSARQAIELTEYFLANFSVDESRVYAAGYSAGGETMSRAVSMRPDLYAAYLHGASQWDGQYAPVAENGVAVYIFMAEGDEYYGSQRGCGRLTTAFASHTRRPAGARKKPNASCSCRLLGRIGLPSGASQETTMAAGMWCLRKPLSWTGLFPTANKRGFCGEGSSGQRPPSSPFIGASRENRETGRKRP